MKKIFIHLVIATLLSGCGKVGREAVEQIAKRLNDDIDTQQVDGASKLVGNNTLRSPSQDSLYHYLEVRASTEIIEHFKRETEFLLPFQYHPYKATLRGVTTVGGESLPAAISITVSKECSWDMQLAFTIFFYDENQLVRSDLMMSSQEALDASAAFEQTYSEVALVDSPDDENGILQSRDLIQNIIKKSPSGFTVEFKNPEKPSVSSDTKVFLTVESELYRLEQMKSGAQHYSYKQFDSSIDALFSTEDVHISSLRQTPIGQDLWLVDTSSFEGDLEYSPPSSRYVELINKNGIPLAFSFESPGLMFDTWLEEFELLQPKECFLD